MDELDMIKNKIFRRYNQYTTGNSAQGCVAAWMWGEFGKNEYMYMYGWVPLLFTWNLHNIVNQLYSNVK